MCNVFGRCRLCSGDFLRRGHSIALSVVVVIAALTAAASAERVPCDSGTMALANHSAYSVMGCGCFHIVNLAMPFAAVNISVVSIGSYISIVSFNPYGVSTLFNVSVSIADLYCPYSSRDFVNDTTSSCGTATTALPPFVSLWVQQSASSITVAISNVLITEPSLGTDAANSIPPSLRCMPLWVGLRGLATEMTNIAVHWRNVTLSHGGVKNVRLEFPGATAVAVVTFVGYVSSVSVTMTDVHITQFFSATLAPVALVTSALRVAFGSCVNALSVSVVNSSINVTVVGVPPDLSTNESSSSTEIFSMSRYTSNASCPVGESTHVTAIIERCSFALYGPSGASVVSVRMGNLSNVNVVVSRVALTAVVVGSAVGNISTKSLSTQVSATVLYMHQLAPSRLTSATVLIVDSHIRSDLKLSNGAGNMFILFAGGAMISTINDSAVTLRNLSLVAAATMEPTLQLQIDSLVIALLLVMDNIGGSAITVSDATTKGSFASRLCSFCAGLGSLAVVNIGGAASNVMLSLRRSVVKLINTDVPTSFAVTTTLVSLFPSSGASMSIRQSNPFLSELFSSLLTQSTNVVANLSLLCEVCNSSSSLSASTSTSVVGLLALPTLLIGSTVAVSESQLTGSSAIIVDSGVRIDTSRIVLANASLLLLSGSIFGGPVMMLSNSEVVLNDSVIEQRSATPSDNSPAASNVFAVSGYHDEFGLINSTIAVQSSTFRSFSSFFHKSNFNTSAVAASAPSTLVIVGCDNEWFDRDSPELGDGIRRQTVANPSTVRVHFQCRWLLSLTRTVAHEFIATVQRPARMEAVVQGVASAVAGGLAMSAAASMQGLALLGGSMCAPPQVRSSSKYTQYLISPFSDLGGVGVVCGNAGVTLAVFALQRALIAWRMHRRKESLERASAKVRYPGWTYVAAVKMMQGVLRSSVELFQVQDAVSGVSRGGGIAVGVLGILYCLMCVALMIRCIRVAFDKMIFVAYPRRAYGSAQFLALKRFLLPVGYWGDESMKSRYGKVVSSVHSGGFRFVAHNVLTTTLVNAAMLASSAGGNACPALFAVCAATKLVAAALLLIYRPSRNPCAGLFDVAANLLSSIISLLLLLMMMGALSDEGQAVAAVGMVLSVVCFAQSVHGVCVTLWERRLSRAKKKQSPSRPHRPQTHGRGTKLKQLFTSVSGEVKNAAGDVGSQLLLEFVPGGYREVDALSSSSSSTGSKLTRVLLKSAEGKVRNVMDRRTRNTPVDDETIATLDSLIRLACQRTLSL